MKTTEEKNRLIAEFMGYSENEKSQFCIPNIGNVEDYLCKFHTSWDWLMPVLEKIERLGFRTIQHGFLQPYGNGTVMYDMYIKKQAKDFEKDGYIYEYEGEWNTSKIESAYNAVVQFIEWYNENK